MPMGIAIAHGASLYA